MSQKEKAEVKIILKKCCYKKLEHRDSMFMLKEKYYAHSQVHHFILGY